MKHIVWTFIVALALAISYVSMAHAQSTDTSAAGSAPASAAGQPPAAAVEIAAPPKLPLTVTTTQEYKAECGDAEVKTVNDGVTVTITAEQAGYKIGCKQKKITKPINELSTKEQADLKDDQDKFGRDYLAKKDPKFKIKPSAADKRAEARLQAQQRAIDDCVVSGYEEDGKRIPFETDEERLGCLSGRITDLMNSGDPNDREKANSFLAEVESGYMEAIGSADKTLAKTYKNFFKDLKSTMGRSYAAKIDGIVSRVQYQNYLANYQRPREEMVAQAFEYTKGCNDENASTPCNWQAANAIFRQLNDPKNRTEFYNANREATRAIMDYQRVSQNTGGQLPISHEQDNDMFIFAQRDMGTYWASLTNLGNEVRNGQFNEQTQNLTGNAVDLSDPFSRFAVTRNTTRTNTGINVGNNGGSTVDYNRGGNAARNAGQPANMYPHGIPSITTGPNTGALTALNSSVVGQQIPGVYSPLFPTTTLPAGTQQIPPSVGTRGVLM